MEIKDIMRVETLPKIYQQLEQMSIEIDNEVNNALALDCTEESKQEVKKARANINKIKTELEDRRKTIKEQILQPYMQFESMYNSLIKDKLVYADDTLKARILNIETQQINEKRENIKAYFEEYLESLHITFVHWDQLNIKIGLSDSEKKLREQVKSKLDTIANDIKLIELEEYRNDILLEYKQNGFDFAKAKLTVVNRMNELQKLQETMNQKQQQDEQDKAIEQKVEEEITIPVEVVEKPVDNATPIITARFQVYGTLEQIKALKQFMLDTDIKFESI